MPITPTNTLTSQVLGSIALAGAEISAYDAASQRVFTTSNSGLQIVDLSDPANPQLVDTISFAFSNDVSSVAVYDGLIAISVISPNRTDPGMVFLLDADGLVLAEFAVGSVPDMVTFSADGTKILVANEGEATFANAITPANPRVDPVGSISVITLDAEELQDSTIYTAGFEAFNAAALITEGVRLFVNSPGYAATATFAGTTVAQDLEPEYIAIAPDGLSAMVTLQEANAVAILNLSGDTPTVTDIVPLGLKSWLGLQFDGSDRDGPGNTQKVAFQTDQNIFGMYMPDAIASYSAGGQTYYVTANEGDDRNDFVTETTTVGNNNYVIDTADYPNAADLKTNVEIGRLTVPRLAGVNGDNDGDGKVDQILTYGGRSISIRDAAGNLVFDTGDQIDTFVAEYFPELFDDGRSDNKGSEPEGVAIASFDGRTYAFIALERFNSTIVYDISDPTAPRIATFLANAGDVAPEQGLFIAAADSATGKPLFLVSNEGSNTLTVYELSEPKLVGGNGDDELVGTILADVMTGGNGNDFIYAGFGDDQLFGDNSDDELDGGAGDDRLSGGRGNDTLTTGAGGDLIVVGRGNGEDVVTDFDTGLDSIQLTGGVALNRTHVVDHDGDGTDDLVLSFKFGGGTLVLLGVSDPSGVDIVAANLSL